MYITYHRLCSFEGKTIKIPHNCLSNEIQQFIENNEVVQEEYVVGCNAFYMFISLNNGDRIDVSF